MTSVSLEMNPALPCPFPYFTDLNIKTAQISFSNICFITLTVTHTPPFTLYPSHLTLHTPSFTLHPPLFTLHPSLPILHHSHSILHPSPFTPTGTTDVTIMLIKEGKYEVQASWGSSACGGMHLDSLLLSCVLRKMKSKGMGIGIKIKPCTVSSYETSLLSSR